MLPAFLAHDSPVLSPMLAVGHLWDFGAAAVGAAIVVFDSVPLSETPAELPACPQPTKNVIPSRINTLFIFFCSYSDYFVYLVQCDPFIGLSLGMPNSMLRPCTHSPTYLIVISDNGLLDLATLHFIHAVTRLPAT
jgi:hypothetical protein